MISYCTYALGSIYFLKSCFSKSSSRPGSPRGTPRKGCVAITSRSHVMVDTHPQAFFTFQCIFSIFLVLWYTESSSRRKIKWSTNGYFFLFLYWQHSLSFRYLTSRAVGAFNVFSVLPCLSLQSLSSISCQFRRAEDPWLVFFCLLIAVCIRIPWCVLLQERNIVRTRAS